MGEIQLNAEQRAAVEYLEGPLLVLAGPGTGKTQLLSSKVAYILENTDANPENILCLTFTEAGAQNMRDRLQTIIGQAANDVNIHTYHAFGRNLLERYQNYAEQLDRRLDTAIDETMQYKIVAEIQKTLPATDILRTASPSDLISTIGSAKAARLTPDDLQKIAEQNLADSADISAEISPILESAPTRPKFAEAIEQIYQPILDVMKQYQSDQPIVGSIPRLANPLIHELELAIETASAEEKPKIKLLSAWKTKHLEKTNGGTFRLKDYIANKKLLSLAGVMRKYNEKLEKDGLFDFNDMIEYTIHYLKTDEGFRLSLCELFQFILLDEFQDTNTSQLELIKLLTDYEQPIVMAVGDDDQAIYEFQGANASNLREFQEHYNAAVICLIENYRSTGEILGLSRKIAEQIDDSFVKNSPYPGIQKNLTAMKDALAQAQIASKLSRHEFECAEAEYHWISKQIRGLIDSGEDPAEIAILAPKHKNLVAILPYLKAQKIDITYEKRENLLQDEKMQEIITMAKFIAELAAEKQPNSMLPEILSFEFWHKPATEVFSLFDRHSSKKTLEILSQNENFADLAEFFANLAAKSFSTPLELWLDYLIGSQELTGFRSPYLDFYEKTMTDAEKLEFYENLATFKQTILTHTASLGQQKPDFAPKLTDFVATINDFEAAGTEIMRISNFKDSNSAVQVMTAYKSKGLEFKHVFLTSVDDLAWGKAKGNNNMLSLPQNLIQIRHTGISDDERLRVLFVAMTRAKASLTMTNSRQTADGKTVKRLTYLEESSPDDKESQISPFLPEATQPIVQHSGELTDAEKVETLTLGWISRYQKQTPALRPLLLSRVENYRLTASGLTSFIDLIYAGPEEVYRRTILRVPDEPATYDQLYGTLAHLVFEQVTTEKIDNTTALESFRQAVSRTTLEHEDQQKLLEAGSQYLEIALNKFGDMLRRKNTKAEVNFSAEHLNWNGVPITGKIDHLYIDPEAKTIEIYDYKTGKFHPEKWSSHPSLYKYQLQLNFYKLLLNLSPSFQNYKVTRGHILFVTPDNDGEVYDKTYEFNEQDETEFKALVSAVYHEIVSLDFIDNPEIFLPANKNNSMKQIREFIEKLLSLDKK